MLMLGETVDDAEEMCQLEYGIQVSDWCLLDDPEPGCQHDRIAVDRTEHGKTVNRLWIGGGHPQSEGEQT